MEIQRELLYESAAISEAAKGFIFPRTFNDTDRYLGSWTLRAGSNSSIVNSHVVPNRTLLYKIPADFFVNEGSTFPLSSSSGEVAMVLESYPVYDSIVGVQVRMAGRLLQEF